MFFTAVELRESAETAGTDHTGDIVSFTAVGSGAGTARPRPWLCYTLPLSTDNFPTNAHWQTPNGTNIERDPNTPAAADDIVTRSFNGATPGVVLYRGTNYFSPDGDYCCVIEGTSERRCVTFSEYTI